MRAVVQRVVSCSVTVDGQETGRVGVGLLVYLGIDQGDGDDDLAYLCDKVANLRIFDDGAGRMNLSARDLGLPILVVSQFTLCADARKGRRPSYSRSADPEAAKRLYDRFIDTLRSQGFDVQQGVFRASMQVSSVNDGPVTILLDSRKTF